MHGFVKLKRRARQPRRVRRVRHQINRDGDRAAAVRAFAGARIWTGRPIPRSTLHEATTQVASNTAYVQAAAVLLEHDDSKLNARVEAGFVPLLQAAASVKAQVELARALRQATPEDRAAAAVRVLNLEETFDLALAVEAAE